MKQKFFAQEGIPTFRWLAKSPDLNKIEQVWGRLKRSVSASEHFPLNLNELDCAVREAWIAKVTRDYCAKLFGHFPKMMEAVIQAGGYRVKG